MHSIGIDIGGTHIKAALVAADGTINNELRISTPQAGPESVIETICTVVHHLDSTNLPIGIGAPGVVDAAGVVYNPANMLNWNTVPLAELLTNKLNRRVVVDNDANCAAIAEAEAGIGSMHSSFLYATIGTGIGGCIIIDRNVFRGVTGGAGEIGHVIVRMDDTTSNTTEHVWRRGTVEEFAGRNGIRTWYHGSADTSIEFLDIPEIAQLALNGDTRAIHTFQETARVLASGFSSVLAILGIPTIIIGGGIPQAYPPLINLVYNQMQQRAIPTIAKQLTILPATFGNAAGVIGAALLAQRNAKQ